LASTKPPDDAPPAGSTIIGVPFESPHPLRSLLLDQGEPTGALDAEAAQRLFKIRAADSEGKRSSANILVNRMYATRGYHSAKPANAAPMQVPSRMTLMASDHEAIIGTITIGFDTGDGLLVDELFGAELDAARAAGRKVCEFTKLAMDSVVKSKRVLASLFHVAYIYAHRLQGFDSLFIEVNPRHVRYYEKMLGFVVSGPERLNLRVNAPAVLLCLDFFHAHDQIAHFGGRPELSGNERSLYPYFFSVQEEAGIVGRLGRLQDGGGML
jgi:hypothetical protein